MFGSRREHGVNQFGRRQWANGVVDGDQVGRRGECGRGRSPLSRIARSRRHEFEVDERDQVAEPCPEVVAIVPATARDTPRHVGAFPEQFRRPLPDRPAVERRERLLLPPAEPRRPPAAGIITATAGIVVPSGVAAPLGTPLNVVVLYDLSPARE